MSDPKPLSDSRYLELLERVVFSGYYSLCGDVESQIHEIRFHGNRVEGIDPNLHFPEVELWEAEQFRRRVSDLQHELGPPSLSDHLETLDTRASNFELKRFFARTLYGSHPVLPKEYRIPIRICDGRLLHFDIQRCTTKAFSQGRDVSRWSIHEQCGWPPNYLQDFHVPNEVVTCLRPLDNKHDSPLIMIGLGNLIDAQGDDTRFILVWFLDMKTLGLVYDYMKRCDKHSDRDSDDDCDDYTDNESHAEHLHGSFAGAGAAFSIATLEGQYRLGDGQDPDTEISTQLDQDITLYVNPIAYKGFLVEDACRTQGVIKPISRQLLEEATLD